MCVCVLCECLCVWYPDAEEDGRKDYKDNGIAPESKVKQRREPEPSDRDRRCSFREDKTVHSFKKSAGRCGGFWIMRYISELCIYTLQIYFRKRTQVIYTKSRLYRKQLRIQTASKP